MQLVKKAEELAPTDLQKYPVWEFINNDELGETAMRPVKKWPVERLLNRLVGAQARLSNGAMVWGLFGNIRTDNPKLTEHLLTFSAERGGKWFMLARYHDHDYISRGPKALADFLGLQIDDVFPIAYDLTPYSRGDIASLAGSIQKEPILRLDRRELIKLSVPRKL